MKSILLHASEDSGFESRLACALDLARHFQGHVTCVHATPLQYAVTADPFFAAALPVAFATELEAESARFQAQVEERLRSNGANWDWVDDKDIALDALVRRSVLADVVVVSRGSSTAEGDDSRYLLGELATASRAPVLAIPEGQRSIEIDAPVLIAWNGSPEAAAATRAALPILRRASRVVLLEVEDKASRYPRDLVARYLSRHDVHAEIVQRPPIEDRISLAIVEAAAEAGAALIVMGAYGHSRLREFLLGGVTRALIHNSPLPLLLAH